MLLLTHRIRLSQPRTKLVVDLRRVGQAKHVHVVSRREGLHLSEAWMVDAARKHEVAVDPLLFRLQRDKRHPHL
jgi:hypothetical protein